MNEVVEQLLRALRLRAAASEMDAAHLMRADTLGAAAICTLFVRGELQDHPEWSALDLFRAIDEQTRVK